MWVRYDSAPGNLVSAQDPPNCLLDLMGANLRVKNCSRFANVTKLAHLCRSLAEIGKLAWAGRSRSMLDQEVIRLKVTQYIDQLCYKLNTLVEAFPTRGTHEAYTTAAESVHGIMPGWHYVRFCFGRRLSSCSLRAKSTRVLSGRQLMVPLMTPHCGSSIKMKPPSSSRRKHRVACC